MQTVRTRQHVSRVQAIFTCNCASIRMMYRSLCTVHWVGVQKGIVSQLFHKIAMHEHSNAANE